MYVVVTTFALRPMLCLWPCIPATSFYFDSYLGYSVIFLLDVNGYAAPVDILTSESLTKNNVSMVWYELVRKNSVKLVKLSTPRL